jgi:hypothetical protein
MKAAGMANAFGLLLGSTTNRIPRSSAAELAGAVVVVDAVATPSELDFEHPARAVTTTTTIVAAQRTRVVPRLVLIPVMSTSLASGPPWARLSFGPESARLEARSDPGAFGGDSA